MSTKATIAHGPTFHFYRECLDDSHVYLQIEGTHFEAGYNRVMVPIPVHVWEVIRQHAGIDLGYADKTDEELRQVVEREVDERIQRCREADGGVRGLLALAGALAYGTADEPREQQITAGLEYFTRLREHQQQVQAAIQELTKANRPA